MEGASVTVTTHQLNPGRPTRKPLRLRMRKLAGTAQLDGGWWPRTRDLHVELRDLVDNFPQEIPRIVGAVYSSPDWDKVPRRVAVAGGSIRVGFRPGVDTHVILLSTAARTVLRLMVVPPGLSEHQGSQALDAAGDSGNNGCAQSLLRSVGY